MSSNHVPLILAFKMTFRTWDSQGVFKEDFEGDLEGDLEVDLEGEIEGDLEVELEGESKGTSEGTSNRTWKGTCCQAQVRSGEGQALSK